MLRRDLKIGRWLVEFYFCQDGFDVDIILDRLFDFGAGAKVMRRALALMESGEPDRGFTFANEYDRVALVLIGPTTSGREFQNTMVHELRHLVNGIAHSLGVPLDSEPPSYIAGGSAMALADVICRLGCDSCR